VILYTIGGQDARTTRV